MTNASNSLLCLCICGFGGDTFDKAAAAAAAGLEAAAAAEGAEPVTVAAGFTAADSTGIGGKPASDQTHHQPSHHAIIPQSHLAMTHCD